MVIVAIVAFRSVPFHLLVVERQYFISYMHTCASVRVVRVYSDTCMHMHMHMHIAYATGLDRT